MVQIENGEMMNHVKITKNITLLLKFINNLNKYLMLMTFFVHIIMRTIMLDLDS